MNNNVIFQRLELLIGAEALTRLAQTKVILFGVGGVGSWCAEALVRSGIQKLTIVDSDVICVTNVNRQLQATSLNIGHVKVDELKKRLLEINPQAEISALQKIYSHSTADEFNLVAYDYVIDAIDSLSSKVSLIERSLQAGRTLYSSLGASGKTDPRQIRVAELHQTKHCHLGRLVKKRLRKRKIPENFLCVYSEELQHDPFPSIIGCGTGQCLCPKKATAENGETVDLHEWCSLKKQINGSIVHITASFGFFLAGLVIEDVLKKAEASIASTLNLPSKAPQTP